MGVTAKWMTLAEYSDFVAEAELHLLKDTKEILAYHGAHDRLGKFVALVDGDGMLLILDDRTNGASRAGEAGALAKQT